MLARSLSSNEKRLSSQMLAVKWLIASKIVASNLHIFTFALSSLWNPFLPSFGTRIFSFVSVEIPWLRGKSRKLYWPSLQLLELFFSPLSGSVCAYSMHTPRYRFAAVKRFHSQDGILLSFSGVLMQFSLKVWKRLVFFLNFWLWFW